MTYSKLAALCLACAAIASPGAAQVPGHLRFEVAAPDRPAPVAASAWYPTEAAGATQRIGDSILFTGEAAVEGGPVAPGLHPLVLVSHGSGGNMDGLAWLGAGLARAGAVVVMVNHPGSTSRDSVPAQSVHLDRRAHDLSRALDQVLADPRLAAHIDPAQISVLGFSMGGGTALQLAGARFDRAQYRSYCDTYAEAAMDCLWLQSDGTRLDDFPAGMEADLRDPRLNRVIAVDPAYGHAFTRQSLTEITVPALLINLGDTGRGTGWEAVGVGPDGADLAGVLVQARYQVIPDAWHFSFLAPCRTLGAVLVWWEGEEPICSDPWGSDRAAVHADLLQHMRAFLGLAPAA